MKDHEVQIIVNTLRDIAIKYGGTQQLREQIHSYIVPILKPKKTEPCPFAKMGNCEMCLRACDAYLEGRI